MNEELKNNFSGGEAYEASAETLSPEISEVETSYCRFCKRELNPDFDFCTFCGKSQREIPAVIPTPVEPEREIPKAIPPKKKKKRISNILFMVFSLTSFAVAFILLISGIFAAITAKGPASQDVFGSLFGSSDNSHILYAILNSVTCLLASLIFTVTGAFFEIIRRMK